MSVCVVMRATKVVDCSYASSRKNSSKETRAGYRQVTAAGRRKGSNTLTTDNNRQIANGQTTRSARVALT